MPKKWFTRGKFGPHTLLVVPLFVLLTSVGFADDVDEKVSTDATRISVDTLSYEDSLAIGLASPKRAFTRSMLGTFVPLPTIVFTVPGLVVGPSLGYFHAGMNGRAWTGIGIRAVGVGGMLSSFAICGWDCGPGDKNYDIAWAVFIGSGGIVVGSAIYDLATMKGRIRKHNAALLAPKSLSFRPVYYSNMRAFGAGLQLRF
jgi:hypothetical protein